MKKKINKQRLKEQLRLGSMALGLALIVWVIAKAGETREATLDVPVVVTSLDPQVEVEIFPATVRTVVRYGEKARSEINSENFKFVVDGSSLQKDLGVSWKSVGISLSEKNWVSNTNVDLAKIGLDGSTVEVKLRYKATPAVIKPEIVGQDQIPEGYQLVSPVKVTPREVNLIGDLDKVQAMPRDELTGRIQLKTAPISVAGRTESGLESVEVLLDPGISMVQRSSNLVEVNLEIQEVQTVRDIKNVPLDFQAVAPDSIEMRYSPKFAAVRVKGPQSQLRQLSPDSFRVNLVRPPEEIPGASPSLPLEVHFAPSVPDELRSRIVIQGIEPATLPVQYISREVSSGDKTTTATDYVR